MSNYLKERLGYAGELENLLNPVCDAFDLGSYSNHRLIEKGYEDVNVAVDTEEGTVLVKIFRKGRSDEQCRQYVEVMRAAVDAGVHHPEVFSGSDGPLHVIETDNPRIRLCVMDYIQGETLEEQEDFTVEEDEIRFLGEQAARITDIDAEPHHEYDSWAIPNLEQEFDRAREFLEEDDLKRIEPLVEEFRTIDLDALPHAFIHNDIRDTHLLRDTEDQLWILDFSVAGHYPRIQELAVMAATTLLGETKEESDENLSILLDAYQEHNQLTGQEEELLPFFIKSSHAMDVIRTTHEKKTEGNTTDENEYWLEKGREGLRQRVSG